MRKRRRWSLRRHLNRPHRPVSVRCPRANRYALRRPMRSRSRRTFASSPRWGATSLAHAARARSTNSVTVASPDVTALKRVHVLVGLIRDEQGRWLVNQRRAGTHMAGWWEFPGGKSQPGEAPFAALRRELD